MQRLALIAAAFVLCAPAAVAQTNVRLEDRDFVRASRCIALANVPQLRADAYNVDALERASRGYSPTQIEREYARSESDQIRQAGIDARRDETALSQLRTRRNESCASFVSTGLVQAAARAQAS